VSKLKRRKRRHEQSAPFRPFPPAGGSEYALQRPRPDTQVPAGVSIQPAAIQSLAQELTRINQQILEQVIRDRPQGRSGDDRKETWVLLSAVGLVLAFCLVAFYVGQEEIRDLHSSLQDEIDRSRQSTASSVERAIAGFHLEKLPESHAALESFLREMDRRGDERVGEFIEKLKTIEGQIASLNRLSTAFRRLEEETWGPEAYGPDSPEPDDDRRLTRTSSGWAAKPPDGAPAPSPTDPLERPPSPED